MGVEPILIEKRSVRTLLNDSPLIENDDPVRVSNRRKAMRDHKRGTSLGKPGECLVNQLFVDRIEMRCGLIKDEDRRVFE